MAYKLSKVQLSCLPLYVLLNSISVISGQSECDNERLCATEPCLQLKKNLPPMRTKLARPAGQCLTNRVVGAFFSQLNILLDL